MAYFDIQVSQSDIKNGARKSCNGCPIARALKRLPRVACVSVFEIGFAVNGHWFEASEEMATFICQFDAGRPVSP